ncbi:outer membrane beta-barrel domain-containing protein [Stigmatella sp. ncwal1]|uniref:Outer membrane beta-barrel domain-containing protein n=1 Tax=Stigmatella ashevillensis TaxID=2995309 RepID=A0ABT5D292_9BACT|nr:outer membrane beta-barrel domain-containing protein [Stigmatella ashevillena]MDC0707210.1 outer membrane beta-barrel domain-containing protein [Stigmatella ashevillena]
MSTVRSLPVLAALTLAMTASSAAGQEEQLLEEAVVRNRLYRPAGNFELSPSVGVSFLTYLTAHYSFNVGLAYNLFDTFALEARGGYALSRHTGLARSISESFLDREDKKVTDELEDLWRMNLHGVVGVRWAPVYGKLSLLADVPAHFQAYLWVGGGVASLKRESLIQCGQVVDRSLGICDDRTDPLDRSTANERFWVKESRAAPVVSAAVGLRFFAFERHGVKLEIRDWAFQDEYRVGLVRDEWEAGRETGEPAGSPGLTHLVQFDVGYTFLF